MPKEIFFASGNSSKINRFHEYFESLGLNVIGPDVELKIIEDGKSPEENALKKAMAGFLQSGKPSIGVDYWLTIKGFSENEQPGPFVRRIFVGTDGQRIEATDSQMLDYYTKRIANLGGRAKGIWTSAIALVVNPDTVFTKTFTRKTIFTSTRSSIITPGEPLNSIQKEPSTCKYLSELPPKENQKEKCVAFMESHLEDLIS